MRPMSMREMHAPCYERGIEFDPADVPLELGELTEVISGRAAWEGRSLAQEVYERRLAERRERRRVPDWFRLRTSFGSHGSARRRARPDATLGRAGRH
jgi:hypothetical protein